MTLDTAINDSNSDQLKARMKKMATLGNLHLYLNAVLSPKLLGVWKLARICPIKVFLTNLLNFLFYRVNKLGPTAIISKSWRNRKGSASRGWSLSHVFGYTYWFGYLLWNINKIRTQSRWATKFWAAMESRKSKRSAHTAPQKRLNLYCKLKKERFRGSSGGTVKALKESKQWQHSCRRLSGSFHPKNI